MSRSPCIARPSSCYSFLFAVVANIIPQLLAKPAVRLEVRSLDYLKVILMTELNSLPARGVLLSLFQLDTPLQTMAQHQVALPHHFKELPNGPPYLAAVENPFPAFWPESLSQLTEGPQSHWEGILAIIYWLFWRCLSKALAPAIARSGPLLRKAAPDNAAKQTSPRLTKLNLSPLGLASTGTQESGKGPPWQQLSLSVPHCSRWALPPSCFPSEEKTSLPPSR